MKRINLNLPKVNIVTDFVYGKAIYKLPNSKKKLKKSQISSNLMKKIYQSIK